MSKFDEREKGFEAKFMLDQDTAFKLTVRRNRLLGLWAAGQLGLSGEAAEAYAKEVVAADFTRPGDSDVIEKVAADFAAKGIALNAARIASELVHFAAEAKKQAKES